ncbi:MAG: hypothetical protein D6796_14805, partial [Caldilineae bacterium]
TPTETPSPPPETPVLQDLAKANNLLIQALQSPTEANLSALSALWQDEAETQVQTFVQTIRQKYQPPLRVWYSIFGLPQITPGANADRVTVQSREFWVYEDVRGKREVLNEYRYTMQNREGRWVIVSYQFEPLPLTGPAQ